LPGEVKYEEKHDAWGIEGALGDLSDCDIGRLRFFQKDDEEVVDKGTGKKVRWAASIKSDGDIKAWTQLHGRDHVSLGKPWILGKKNQGGFPVRSSVNPNNRKIPPPPGTI